MNAIEAWSGTLTEFYVLLICYILLVVHIGAQSVVSLGAKTQPSSFGSEICQTGVERGEQVKSKNKNSISELRKILSVSASLKHTNLTLKIGN